MSKVYFDFDDAANAELKSTFADSLTKLTFKADFSTAAACLPRQMMSEGMHSRREREQLGHTLSANANTLSAEQRDSGSQNYGKQVQA